MNLSDRVRWLGRATDDELVGAYLAATALWFPSNARSEGFGLVQVEAMANGCPVINTSIPASGVSWVCRHEQEGLTVPVNDPAAFAAAANRLVSEPDFRARLSAAAPPAGRRVRLADDGRAEFGFVPFGGGGTAVKVLHLYAGNLYGGVETYLATLARLRHLAPDMEPGFGLCFRGRLWDELTAAGVPLFELGAVRVSRPWTALAARNRLRKVLAEWRPDVVLVHSGWLHLVFGPAVKAAGGRLVFFAHNPLDTPSWLDRWAARTVPDLVLANSMFTAASVPKLCPGVRTEVSYLPVQVHLPEDRAGIRAAVRAELGATDTTTVILTACRLERWKGHTLLLDALGKLKDRPGWVSWIAGGVQRPHEAAYLNELKATAERLGIADRVTFLGQRSDVPRLLVAADVHCQPNTGPEPFGVAFVEALAAGLPVVTTAMGGALEIVDDTCGVLAPPGDAAALAAALGRSALPGLRFEGGPRRASELCGSEVNFSRLASVLNEIGG